ncbi:hypothetical protein L838_4852 [Mycobacterium avium MAV_120709_2344]|nr:hypothetical protein L838_4852 [Mycobacterium avium MAV_120709_2344]
MLTPQVSPNVHWRRASRGFFALSARSAAAGSATRPETKA